MKCDYCGSEEFHIGEMIQIPVKVFRYTEDDPPQMEWGYLKSFKCPFCVKDTLKPQSP